MPGIRLPHARGGVSTICPNPVSCPGSSPRTWGCFHKRDLIAVMLGVFPTHVGVFLFMNSKLMSIV